MEVYYASSCALIEDKEFSIKVNDIVKTLGFSIYTPATNDSINDKTNNPTPDMIYKADIDRLMNCDILLVNINGGHQDGTIFEVGAVCMFNEQHERKKIIIPFTRNQRLLDTQTHNGIASASVNHLVLGGLGKWSKIDGLLTFEKAINKLKELKNEG